MRGRCCARGATVYRPDRTELQAGPGLHTPLCPRHTHRRSETRARSHVEGKCAVSGFCFKMRQEFPWGGGEASLLA